MLRFIKRTPIEEARDYYEASIALTQSPLYPFSTMENPFPVANSIATESRLLPTEEIMKRGEIFAEHDYALRKAINGEVTAKAYANAYIKSIGGT